ncbi:hypothetical protein PV325_006088 [Microctonus aethiopoides]|uniref:GH18 domain-containing protein n=1 Tax=Microctonus aethiopoides TaxID=144406 RepID=A0AA39KM79_9HYME|nr:hypothetical protein PV325_006088 [Microctonus aethiopoides]KAK0095682.1 hypothetical protein PV326_007694 [Microctonus aethiopoides]KAK0166512.1 hypothetical protein PV328_004927 [Microctonus aethiopoides]
MPQEFFYIAIIFIAIYLSSSLAIRDPLRPTHDKVVVCYVASWAQYRPGKGEFKFDDFKPNHCTHVIYSFAGLNVTTSTIRSLDPWADFEEDYGKGMYKKVTGLRRLYPHLKVSLAIGGWNEGSANYSALAASPQRRSTFISSVILFLKNNNFDGLDLDWEFPGKRGGAPYDKVNFISLIKELRESMSQHNLLLTAAISADKKTIDIAYDISEISKYLDFIHVMAYDYHGSWDTYVAPNAPLKCDDELCAESSMNYLLKLGAPPEKLVLGLAMYGRTFILTSKLNDSESPIGRPSLNRGFQGNYTREDGFMGYNEICKELVQSPQNWRVGTDKDKNYVWAVHDDKVVVYDNLITIAEKVKYAKKTNLAGVMVWSIDTDDFTGECANLHSDILDPLTGLDYPLVRAINIAFTKTSSSDDVENRLQSDKSSAILYFVDIWIIKICFILSMQMMY